MKKVLIGCVLGITFFGWQHPVHAASYVYAHVASDGQQIVLPVSATQVVHLTAKEKLTLQTTRQYHALFTPSDPYWPLQWNLVNMNLPSAWDAAVTPPFTGTSGVIVAVLDTGVAYENNGLSKQASDLATMHVWTNVGEIDGDGVDNDGNGFIDDVHGWNFINDNGHPDDDNGHGTHVTDTIAGGINNSVGIAGIAPSVTILPIKVLDSTGTGTTATIANGIRYAMANGANIINLSLGGTQDDPLLASAIHDAEAAGIVVIAAAGNDGGSTLNFPARYNGVVSVGAVQYDESRTSYSNYGPGLTVMAPGGNVDLDQNGDGSPDGIAAQTCSSTSCSTFSMQYYEGTSQAAAQVSGVMALLEACGGTAATATNALISTAADGGAAGYDTMYGYGVVNAQAALNALGCVSTSPAAPTNLRVISSMTSTLALTDTRTWPFKRPLFRWAAIPGLTYHIQWGKLGSAPKLTTQTTNGFQPTISTSGTYRLVLTASDDAGRTSSSTVLMYRYRPSVLLAASGTSVRSYSMSGAPSVTFSTSMKSPTGVASAVNLDGSAAAFVSDLTKNSAVLVFTASGARRQTIRPFGTSYSGGLSAGIMHTSGQLATLVTASTTAGDVRWISSSGEQVFRIINSKDRGYSVAAGDLDADGNDEVVLAERRGPSVRVYSNAGVLQKTIQPLGSSYRGGWVVTVGDVTGDGKADIVLIRADARQDPKVYIINGSGKTTKTFIMKGVTLSQTILLTALNTDGLAADHILVGGAGAATVSLWKSSGTRTGQITLGGQPKISSVGAWQ